MKAPRSLNVTVIFIYLILYDNRMRHIFIAHGFKTPLKNLTYYIYPKRNTGILQQWNEWV